MRGVLLASLRHHTRRYVAASLAVIIGVAFVVVTGMLTGATRSGLTADVGAPVSGVDRVVTVTDPADARRLLDGARERDLPALGLGFALEPVASDGVQLASSVDIAEVSTDPALQWQTLEDGRFPDRDDEAVADANAAKSNGVEIGDVLRVGAGSDAVDVEVVGMVDSPVTLGAALYVPWPTLRHFGDSLWIEHVAWGGPPDVAEALAGGATVASADEWVAERQAEISRSVDVLAIMAMVFVAIALFVAVMVITNTFAILFTQRMRDFALLRCVGVTRGQLRRAARVEALVLGVVASTIGILAGALVGAGLVQLVRRWFDDMGDPTLTAPWVGGAFAVGVLVTLAAAWLPSRTATRVAPLAALRPVTGVDVRSRAGRWRLATAALALTGGVALMALSVPTHLVPVMIAGGAISFLGVILVGPALVPALIRAIGGLPGAGPVRRLATANAVRNPRRTATTAASLLVGVTLTTAVLTGLASSRTALDQEMDESHPVDAAVTAVDRPLDAGLADRVRALERVDQVTALDGTFGSIGEVTLPLLGLAGRADVVRGPDDLAPRDGVVILPYGLLDELPGATAKAVRRTDQITLDTDRGSQTLDVVLDDGWGSSGLVSASTLASLTDDPQPLAVWVRAAHGADAEDLSGDLAALAAASGAESSGGYVERSWVDTQVDVLTGSVVGLLGIAVVIALIGIANTLGLSVLERVRENSLLRAMGLTRRDLRRAMATEGMLLSLVAALLGTTLGLAYAWVGVQVMVTAVVDGAGVSVPVGQLAAVVVASSLAGLIACVLPSRRAARIAPAAGLALD